MAQIGTLGKVIFQVSDKTVQTFKGLKISSSVSYSETKRHLKKPLLEFTNPDLDKASFDIYFSAYLGVNPRKQQAIIDYYMNNGEILLFIVGNIRYGTKWVIDSHSKDMEYFDKNGNLLAAKSSISLKEYAER